MKKFFAFAIALVAMATSMVSCNNDNADFIEQKAPVAPTGTTVEKTNPKEKMDVSLVVAVTKQQQQYLYDSYIIQIPGKIQTVMVSDMEPATPEQIETFTLGLQQIEAADLDRKDVDFYAFNLGQVSSSDDVKLLSHDFEAKLHHPSEDFHFIDASCFIIGGRQFKTYMTNGTLSAPGNDEELIGFAESASKDMSK